MTAKKKKKCIHNVWAEGSKSLSHAAVPFHPTPTDMDGMVNRGPFRPANSRQRNNLRDNPSIPTFWSGGRKNQKRIVSNSPHAQCTSLPHPAATTRTLPGLRWHTHFTGWACPACGTIATHKPHQALLGLHNASLFQASKQRAATAPNATVPNVTASHGIASKLSWEFESNPGGKLSIVGLMPFTNWGTAKSPSTTPHPPKLGGGWPSWIQSGVGIPCKGDAH